MISLDLRVLLRDCYPVDRLYLTRSFRRFCNNIFTCVGLFCFLCVAVGSSMVVQLGVVQLVLDR